MPSALCISPNADASAATGAGPSEREDMFHFQSFRSGNLSWTKNSRLSIYWPDCEVSGPKKLPSRKI